MADRHTVILNTDHQRQRACQMALRAPAGWSVTYSPPTRTNAQNDAMWALLTDVSHARPMGRVHTPEVWKCIFMDSTGHQVKWVPSLDGESVVNVGYRSSRLTKPQMSELIESINAFASEQGIFEQRQAA